MNKPIKSGEQKSGTHNRSEIEKTGKVRPCKYVIIDDINKFEYVR